MWFHDARLPDVSQVSVVLVDKRKLTRSEERRDLSCDRNDNCIQLLKFFLKFLPGKYLLSTIEHKQYKQYRGHITCIY